MKGKRNRRVCGVKLRALRSVSPQPVFVLEIFVFVVLFLLLAVEAELLDGGAAVLAEALPTYLALVDGLRLHAADEALRHTFTSLLHPYSRISKRFYSRYIHFVSLILK